MNALLSLPLSIRIPLSLELAPDIPEFNTNKLSLISVFVELI